MLRNLPRRSFAVVPADTGLANSCSGLWVGVGGTLVVEFHDDTAATTWLNVPNGTMIPGNIKRVRTGTTCTNIIGVVG